MSKGTIMQPRKWASREDGEHVGRLLAEYKVLVMGRNSYEAGPMPPDPAHLLTVLTSDPDKFKDAMVPGQLEFVRAEPTEIVAKLEARGFDKIIIFGGRPVHSAFLAAGLVDEVQITVEPRLFGSGISFLTDELVDIPLHLEEMQRLNEQGTVLLRYHVVKK
jgi:dihydrofolate reductase